MSQLERIMGEAKRTGRVWLGGEMDFPANEGAMVAYHRAVMIAEACGYLVTRNGTSMFSVAGGEIPGYFVCDWFTPDAKNIGKVELWTSEAAYS